MKVCTTSYGNMHQGNVNFKKQWGTTTHQLEQLKSGTLPTASACEEVEQEELSVIAGGNAKWYSHFGRHFSFVVSYKTKHTLTIWSSDNALWYLTKWAENMCPHKNLL